MKSMQKTLDILNVLGLKDTECADIIKRLKREPNVLECYILSSMWSEHCAYKHSKKYIKKLPKEGSLYANENAGGIKIGSHIVFFKAESHNHPCAIEPYQGAATGIGGIIRDILALNARPCLLMDSLKFGEIEGNDSICSRNKYLLEGVTEGISDYGNSIGVPTAGGEVEFNRCYNDSPLVNVLAAGIAHKDKVKLSGAKSGSYIVLVGSATGRDGLFGASFASKDLNIKTNKERSSVQIGDPYTKKNLIEASLKILEIPNVYSCQDLGAAGILSASSEMVYKGKKGVDIHIDNVYLREKDMEPYEILLSESQERMLFCADKKGIEDIEKIAGDYSLFVSVIGKITDTKCYRVFNKKGVLLCDLPVSLICESPEYELSYKKPAYIGNAKKSFDVKSYDIKNAAEKIVSSPDFASKKMIYETYDYTVQNRTAVYPGESGACVLWMREENTYIAFSMDSKPTFVYIDPYKGCLSTVYESARNLIASGFKPLGITDCLNFANPENSDTAFQFIESIKGIKDACINLQIPVVSGNVSFYNETPDKKIHPTPVIGMLGILNSKNILKSKTFEHNSIYLIGKNIDANSNIGGSLYQKVLYNFEGDAVDDIDFALESKLSGTMYELNNKDIINGATDVSKGGILGTLLIMLFNSNLGFCACLDTFLPDIKLLFGEIESRYLVSVKNDNAFINFMKNKNIFYKKLGEAKKGNIDLGFEKFNFEQLKSLYYTSLGKKAQ